MNESHPLQDHLDETYAKRILECVRIEGVDVRPGSCLFEVG